MSEKLEFKISAGLKNIIGKELITDDDIAIFELVKNAYDANAKKVKIIFENLKNNEKGQKKILIIDDGDGMSYDDIKNKWLFVGYSEKKEIQKEKSYRDKIKKKGRFLAGYKGIGRFSADRLGPKLNLYTKKNNEREIHAVKMDWTKFEKDQNKKFETVNVEYSPENNLSSHKFPIKNFSKGTILEIFPLRDNWDKTKLLKLRRYLQRLINPSQDPETQKFKIELIAKEFEKEDAGELKKPKKKPEAIPAIINGLIKNIVFEKLNIKTTQITCQIKDDEIISELVDKGKFVFKIREELPIKFSRLHDIFIRIFYLNEDAKTSFTTIMGLQPIRYGSVFFYKNGFRIHPLGDDGNDWLSLELRKTQGYRRYLSTREIIGRIEAYGDQPGFNEVSSRSGGVVKSPEYEQLTKFFIEKVLRKLERYVVEGIAWDSELKTGKTKSEDEIRRDSIELIAKLADNDKKNIVAVNKDLYKILKDRQQTNIPQLIKNVEKLKKHVKSNPEKKYLEKQIKSVRAATRTLRINYKLKTKQVEKLKKETKLFKGVVEEKHQLENLYHSITIASQMIEGSILDINLAIHKNKPISEVIPHIDGIAQENQKIKSLINVAKRAKFSMKTEDKKKDLVAYIREYVEIVHKRWSNKLECKFENDQITFNTIFESLEIAMVLDNLGSNAYKAKAQIMKFKFENQGNKLVLFVGDNGNGVPQKNSKKIFDREFSTTPGSGIGLHHLNKIMIKNHGTIEFVGNRITGMGSGACFKLMFK